MVTENKPAVVFTEAATVKLQEVLKEQGALESYLRIAISSTPRGGVEYVFGLEEAPSDNDQVVEQGWLKALVDQDSLPLLEGASVDYVEGFQRSGFVISNPNLAGGGCACGGGGCGCGGAGPGGHGHGAEHGHGGEMEAEEISDDEAQSGGCACGGGGCGKH